MISSFTQRETFNTCIMSIQITINRNIQTYPNRTWDIVDFAMSEEFRETVKEGKNQDK